MKKTLDSSVTRVGMGLLVLTLGLGSARVVVSSADADQPSAALVATAETTVPEHLGSIAGLVAGNELIENASTTQVKRYDRQVGDLLAAGRAASIVSDTNEPEPTTTIPDEGPSTTVEDPTTTSTSPAPIPPTTTSTTSPPETTTTTSPPETTTTTSPPETTTTTVGSGSYTGVLTESEALELFSMYFSGGDVDTAMRVAKCESSYNTNAYNPAGYGGLFQHSIADWPDRSASAGWAGASIYDGEANTAVAAWLVSVSGWSPWPSC